MKKILLAALAMAVLSPCAAFAGDNSEALKRDEVAVIKKKLNTVLDAMGLPPAGYVKNSEDFNLPTEVFKENGKLVSVQSSVKREFVLKALADAGGGSRASQIDLQKKVLEAQAKGDYETMSRLMQEATKKSGEAQMASLKAQEAHSTSITLSISLNDWVSRKIDPDMVVLEKPGVLALKGEQSEDGDGSAENSETVSVFFQPVTLKDTKELSNIEVKTGVVPARTSVCVAEISITGSPADVEAWAKRINTDKVLAIVDATVK